MRQKFPDGSGGPFEVPGVGRVIGGEPFDYPELISACVPVEDGEGDAPQAAGSTAEPGADESKGGEGEGADSRTEAQGRPRAKGTRP